MKLLTQSVTKRRRKPANLRYQAGVSLVEVMVAMLVTTAGLLGFAGLQTRALNATEDAYVRTQAMSLGQDLLERMRINGVSPDQQSFAVSAPGFTAYSTASNWTGALPTGLPTACFPTGWGLPLPTGCNATAMATADIAQVRRRAASLLPNGNMLMRAGCSNSQACVYVAWGDTSASDCADDYTTTLTVRRQCVVVQGI